jgi:LuxR family maltose regulon positive regulatory protein
MKDPLRITSLEEKIILLVREGMTNKGIAAVVGKSQDTIKYHLKKIYKTLGADNRVKAINKYNELLKTNK